MRVLQHYSDSGKSIKFHFLIHFTCIVQHYLKLLIQLFKSKFEDLKFAF